MKFLVTMFTNDQEKNTAEKLHQEMCDQTAEMGLLTTHVYTEAVKMNSQYKSDIKTATVKGAIAGAAAACLIGVGALGYNKFLNYRRSKKIEKEMTKMGY